MKKLLVVIPIVLALASGLFYAYSQGFVFHEPRVKDLLTSEKFTELESELQILLDRRELEEDGRLKSSDAQRELEPSISDPDETFIRYIGLYNKWLKISPNSHFANAGLGVLYHSYAWKARGNDFASTITPEAKELLHERIEVAAIYLQKAYEINPKNSYVASKMISTAKLHPDMSDGDVWKWFKRAVEANPIDDFPYRNMADFLLPKWGGSYEQCFSFVRNASDNASPNSMIPAVLAQVHLNYFFDEKDVNYFKNPEVWSEVKVVYTKLTDRFPKSIDRHNWFARIACWAEDYKIVKQETDIIGDRWQQHVWNTEDSYKSCKDLAAQHTDI